MNTIIATFSFILSLAVFFGCSSSMNNLEPYSGSSFSAKNKIIYQNDAPTDERVNRKILYTADLSIIVEDIDSTISNLKFIANSHQGYVQHIRNSYTVLRIKSNQLENAVDAVSKLGTVTRKNINAQDVTEEHLDYQIRLENAKKSRDRYLELLARAENVSAALEVEHELERLNEIIDLYSGKIKRLEYHSEFSTLTVNLERERKPGLIGYVGLGLYKSMKWLFVRN